MSAYDTITQQILTQLEHGTIPWRCPWRAQSLPKNLFSQKLYRGINVWLLITRPYASPYWLTYKQAREIGGWVRAGEKGTSVVFWKFDGGQHKEDDTNATPTRRPPLLRSYTLFNSEQCELPASLTARLAPPVERPLATLAVCEQVVTQMGNPPTIAHDSRAASYSPHTDTIHLPPLSLFTSAEEYFSTLYHEIVHSTGIAARLARPSVMTPTTFASHAYSKEELIAEMGAAFLCGHCGIVAQTLENSAAYIQHWLTVLRNDKTLLIHAAAHAQRAVDYILGVPSSAPSSTPA